MKLLRSPYANAVIKDINADIAMKVPGIEAVFTYKDIDQNMKRFTCAGQTYPEPIRMKVQNLPPCWTDMR